MSNKVNEKQEKIVEPEVKQEPISNEQLASAIVGVANAVEKIAGKEASPSINIDVDTKKKTKSPELLAKLANAAARDMERVELIIPEPDDDLEAARGSTTISHNGKNYQIMYGVKVLIPRAVANIYLESVKLKKEATVRRRKILKELAYGKAKV